MSVRTYNPSVRVGNWNEDIQLEEDTLKDFLERRERGELLIQKSSNLKNTVLKPVDLDISRDGKVHFGNHFMLVNPGAKDGSRGPAALSINLGANGTPGVAGSSDTKPCARNTFTIKSLDGTPDGECVKYGQHFNLCSADGESYLSSDRASFQSCAKKSRHSEVRLVGAPSHLTVWQLVSYDPLFRMELEYSDVRANDPLLVNHVKTNNNLCIEAEHKIRTVFGSEHEITSFTDLDSHKAEKDSNHWLLLMNVPGDPIMPLGEPKPE